MTSAAHTTVSQSASSLFPEGGVVWRIHGSPVAMAIGGLRALMIQALHPRTMAGVAAHSTYAREPLGRAGRTFRYIATVTFGSTEDAERASARVRDIHERVRGIDPATGASYRADDPELLLWVHCVAYHSFLTAYRTYGGHLSDEESDHYLAEVSRATALLGLDPRLVPKSRGEMREYFAGITGLRVSEAARRVLETVVHPPIPTLFKPLWRLPAAAAIGLLPQQIRSIYGLPQPSLREKGLRLGAAPLGRICNAVFPTSRLVRRLRQELAAERETTTSTSVPAAPAMPLNSEITGQSYSAHFAGDRDARRYAIGSWAFVATFYAAYAGLLLGELPPWLMASVMVMLVPRYTMFQHELFHLRKADDVDWFNRLIFVVATPFSVGYRELRQFHLGHHRNPAGENDPDAFHILGGPLRAAFGALTVPEQTFFRWAANHGMTTRLKIEATVRLLIFASLVAVGGWSFLWFWIPLRLSYSTGDFVFNHLLHERQGRPGTYSLPVPGALKNLLILLFGQTVVLATLHHREHHRHPRVRATNLPYVGA